MTIKIDEFARYEFKYVLRASKAELIESQVQNFMYYDSFIENIPGNQYPVRSLYFENDIRSNFYEKTDGLKSRRKYRLRTYSSGNDPSTGIFFEEKGKHNERTYKRRIKINPEHLILFEQTDRAFELLPLHPGIDLIETFIFDSERKNLKPCAIVDYLRRPYVSDYDMNFRVTFDRDLRANASSVLLQDVPAFRECIAGYTILELKFHRRIPRWFHHLIQTYDLRRQSISKFVVGMKTCELAVDLS